MMRNAFVRMAGRLWLLLLLLGLVGPSPAMATAQSVDPFVCTELVIAIDGSKSTRTWDFERQIRALQGAFRAPLLADALQDCLPGSIGLSLISWSGPPAPRLCADWWPITGPAGLEAAGQRLADCELIGGTTDIGSALAFAVGQFARSPFLAHHQAVLLITNGRTDPGREARLETARAAAREAGVTIATHAILGHRPTPSPAGELWREFPLQDYATDHIAAGRRALVTASRPEHDEAMLLKALVEILRQELG